MRFLSEEWLAYRLSRTADFVLTDRPSVRVQHVVAGFDDGSVVRYFDEVVEGALVSSGLGDIDEPDFEVHNTWRDELDIMRGEMDPYLAVVEGTVRVAGDTSRLLVYLPMLQHHQRELEDITADLVNSIKQANGS